MEKYCINCLHYKEAGKFSPPTCKSPNRVRHLVTGAYKYLPCEESRYSEEHCSTEGKWFELKKE